MAALFNLARTRKLFLTYLLMPAAAYINQLQLLALALFLYCSSQFRLFGSIPTEPEYVSSPLSSFALGNQPRYGMFSGKAPLSSLASSHNGQPFTLKTVPLMTRFDYPWHIPNPVYFPSLEQSRYRILFSPVRVHVGSGLGHGMAILNMEVNTAFRFGLTYTHRIGKYGHLSSPPNPADDPNVTAQFQCAAGIERLFGWGAGEIPREQLYPILCGPDFVASENRCPICNGSWTGSNHRRRKVPSYVKYNFRVDHVVEIPDDLSYTFPGKPSKSDREKLDAFLKKHPYPYTVFTMPASRCDKFPAYSFFAPVARSFYFNKYWKAHGGDGPSGLADIEDHQTNESFPQFFKRVTANRVIPHFGRRPVLSRLNVSKINIAVHARRGDFFDANRPMVSVRVIGILVRFLISKVFQAKMGPRSDCEKGGRENCTNNRVHSDDDTSIFQFARMPICLSIYSEGRSKSGEGGAHDVRKMTREFVDIDGRVLKSTEVADIVNAGEGHGVEVNLRISDNTILSIHEMVAADVFIGSNSGMSTHVIGSMSRAAFLLQVTRGADVNNRFVEYNSSTGEMPAKEVAKLKRLWRMYVQQHRGQGESAPPASTVRRMVETYSKASPMEDMAVRLHQSVRLQRI